MITADLTGKAALVTGGASGIGLATATLLARCGASVAVNYLADDPRGREVVDRFAAGGVVVTAAPGNVADPADARRMVEAAIDRLGRLDILVNNAGTSGTVEPIDFADLEAMSEEFWQRILGTNLLGPFRCARAAAPALKRSGGAIVNVASIAGLGRRGSSVAYGASKAGLINLTIALAKALAPEVRVNAVAPGLVETGWTAAWPEERKRATIDKTLLRRAAKPEDIAEAILYLSAGAAFVTGQTLVVDGGME
jgi:3-oxoacyl-[acyl-carrier protein] reductase